MENLLENSAVVTPVDQNALKFLECFQIKYFQVRWLQTLFGFFWFVSVAVVRHIGEKRFLMFFTYDAEYFYLLVSKKNEHCS